MSNAPDQSGVAPLGGALMATTAWIAVAGGLLSIAAALLVTVSVVGRWLGFGSVPGDFELVQIAVALAEGWRGELCHVALTDGAGRFEHYKVVDPSFHNWNGLAYALRGQQISDFPLCNKSFNLSYCGHDL